MKAFNHTNAGTLGEASAALARGQASLIAGGTDLLGTLKDDILPLYPNNVVNIKSVPGLDYIREEDGELRIGALTRIADIAADGTVKAKYAALGQAAAAVASPNIREMGTIGGNISQLPRCWYFRKPGNRFNCIRKGGAECYAMTGDNRFHSVFGGRRPCATPCSLECPAGTDIPAYLARIRKGDWDGAAEIIMRVNPMPALTSRVCAHFCQNKCNHATTGDSVCISGVERALGDWILDNSERFYAPPTALTGKSAAVVGAGPAGLAAAFYLRRAGHAVTVIDAKEEAGGMLMYAIPAYRLPKDTVRRFTRALEGMGVAFRLGTRVGQDISPEELERTYDSVCYSTGTWKRPVVGIGGEELTVFGLDFLVEVKDWMDGKIGSQVLVTGGGNVAMDVAVTAKRLGAKSVTLVCLESRETMPASAEEIARAEEEGVVIMPSWGLSKVVQRGGAVAGMELKRCLSTHDENGTFRPSYDEGDKITVSAENVLMAIGQSVDLSFLDEKYKFQLSRRGLIEIDDNSMTSRRGIYAAGDAATGPGTVIRAIANGHRAADGMNTFLDCGAPPSGDEYGQSGALLMSDAQYNQAAVAMKLREVDVSQRRIDVEDSFTPTREEAALEARRCLTCSCYAVHPSDIAPALIALGAHIVTNRRTLGAEEFFTVRIPGGTALSVDEIVTEIRIPVPAAGAKSAFIKFAFRKSIDFPVVNCAVSVGTDSPRICLNAVAPTPYRALEAEDYIAGKPIDEATADAAGRAAVRNAAPFEATQYKIQLAKTMVKRALLKTVD
ncbi:MAG: FAD binding domain-containing protein [Oscillospiraceae bacterium]|jgi:NADPH-dependent glutamate synthase beta subunit-like oxidoreductase|nr:FAD binding domain-containing protein [Oscillospiraceae bacterium]